MTNTRKILTGMVAATGLAFATVTVYAAPPAGYGPGSGGCAYSGAGPGMAGAGAWGGGAMGRGMMAYGGGPRGGYGPGMMGQGGGPRGGYGPGMMSGGGFGPGAAAGGRAAVNMEERMDARQSFLKNELKITADQQAAWDAFATQAKTQAATMQAFHAQPPSTAQTATERIEQRAERAKLRAEQMKTMSAAVKDLYAVLTPEQKAVADQHFGGPRLSQAGPRGYGRSN